MRHDPLTLFRAAADGLQRRDWRAVALLCDPASLTSFKRQLLTQYAPAEQPPPMTVEQWMRYRPETPQEVAEYQVAQINRHGDPVLRLQAIRGIESVERLQALSPLEVFTAWLESRAPEAQIEEMRQLEQIPEAMADEMKEAIRRELSPRYVPLAAVADGEWLAHLVYREEPLPMDEEREKAAEWVTGLSAEEQALAHDLWGRENLKTMTCRRQSDGEWRLLAGFDFFGMGTSMAFVHVEEPQADGPTEES